MKKIVIVGAGIFGASCAYHLAKAGADVLVIDRGETGRSTDAAAGVLCPWLSQRRNKDWYLLAKLGTRYFPELVEELEKDGETDTGYRRVGVITLHRDRSKLEKMKERVLKRREDAPEMGEVRELAPDEAAEMFPLLSKDFYFLYVSGAARVNGSALREALLNAAKKHGAKTAIRSAELDFQGNTVTGVFASGEYYPADTVIVAAGAWTPELLWPLGIRMKVRGQKGQIVHLQLRNRETEDWPMLMLPESQYILPFDDGRILAGSTHEDDDAFDERVTAGGLHAILDKALSAAPGLAEGQFLEARFGFRPVAPDFMPAFGPVPGFDGLLVANGLGSSGLTVGPYLGLQVAKIALGEKCDVPLSPYDVSRIIER
jgi:D-amino-acid dehydrogenase